jgi:hypothetical protein
MRRPFIPQARAVQVLGQGQREGPVGAGVAGGEQVEAGEALVRQPRRAHAGFVPAVAGPALLADAGLILAPELDLCFRVGAGDLGEPRPEPVF